MLLNIFRFASIFPILLAFLFQQVQENAPRIDIPLEGDTVRGVVGIVGSTDIEGFASSEVFFGFSPNGAWFSLGTQDRSISSQLITNWDTTVIPDGLYRLKVVVTKADGSQAEAAVNNIQVSNYSSPAGVSGQQIQGNPTAAPDYPVDARATATAFPANPAAVDGADLFASMKSGLLWTAAIFLALGIYLGLRWLNKKR